MISGSGSPAPAQPLVSVVIPTFNRGRLLLHAVESALAQTEANIEVIVVDDGSTDETSQLLESYQDRIKYLWQPNSGVGAARNAGMEKASGEFIAFLDSDDRWKNWKIAVQLAAFRRFPELQLACSDASSIDDEGREVDALYLRRYLTAYNYFDVKKLFETHISLHELCPNIAGLPPGSHARVGDLSSAIFMGNLILTPSVVFRRELVSHYGAFDLSIGDAGEDYDLFARFCQAGPVALIDAAAIEVRIGGNDHLRTQRSKMALANLVTMRRLEQRSGGIFRLDQAMVQRRRVDALAWAGLALFDEGRAREARRYLWQVVASRYRRRRIVIYAVMSLFPDRVIELARSAFHWARQLARRCRVGS